MTYDFVQLILLNIGVLLVLALIVGKLVSLIKLPKVTGYILVGLIMGPPILGHIYPSYNDLILSYKILEIFKIITEVGLGLIIFNIGGEFQLENFKKLGKKVLWISVFEILLTVIIVTALSFATFLIFFSGIGVKGLSYSLLLGIVAIATAPAATLLVLREYESEGPITNHLLVLIGLNNILCILAFKLVFSGLVSETPKFIQPLTEVMGSILLGIVTGLLLSFFEKWLEKPVEQFMLILGGICLNIGISFIMREWFTSIYISNLLANLFMGITMINSTTKGDSSFKALKNADMPIYALFFVLAGANLHIKEFLESGAVIIVFCTVYIIGRAAGKYFGTYYGILKTGLVAKLGKGMGLGLYPKAGVAIGLAILLKEGLMPQDPNMANSLSTVILSAVIVFELIGPIFTRYVISKGGEVKEISLSKKKYQSNKRRYLRVLARLRHSLGIPKWKEKFHHKDVTCEDVMRSSVEYIFEDMHFEEVISFASHCKYDHFPVVDRDHHFVGTISYSEIRDILFDDDFAELIIARDILNEDPHIARPGDSLKRLLILFHSSGDDIDFLPVVDDHDPPHLIGIVSQKDVIAAYQKMNPTENGSD